MLTGQPPFNFSNQNLIKEAKLTQDVKYPEKLDPRIQDILQNLLHREPDRRVTDLDYFKLRLLDLGVDLDLISKDRYSYEILIQHDYVKSRGKSPVIDTEPYNVKDPATIEKMRDLDQTIIFNRFDPKAEKPKTVPRIYSMSKKDPHILRESEMKNATHTHVYPDQIPEDPMSFGVISMQTTSMSKNKNYISLSKIVD